MRIEAVQPVAAPPEAVFARLTDFSGFEERARRRQLPVERLDHDPPGWRIGIVWMGMSYQVDLQVDEVTPPEGYTASLATRGVEGRADIGIAAAPPGSVLRVTLDAEGRDLAGRLVLRTLGVARDALEGRLRRALAGLAAEIEGGVAVRLG